MTATISNESITDLARTLGNKRGWKERMPAKPAWPPTLQPNGNWKQETKDGVTRLRYQEDIGMPWHTIGQWSANEPAAPSRNGKAPTPAPPPSAPPPVPPADAPEPLILLTPAGDRAWRLSAYGLAADQTISALRLSLLHLVAKQSGALIIDEVISDTFAVVVPPKPSAKPASRKAGRVRTTVAFPDDDIDDEEAW